MCLNERKHSEIFSSLVHILISSLLVIKIMQGRHKNISLSSTLLAFSERRFLNFQVSCERV